MLENGKSPQSRSWLQEEFLSVLLNASGKGWDKVFVFALAKKGACFHSRSSFEKRDVAWTPFLLGFTIGRTSLLARGCPWLRLVDRKGPLRTLAGRNRGVAWGQEHGPEARDLCQGNDSELPTIVDKATVTVPNRRLE